MAELARLGQVSRARISQIVNLLMLAPDIQEELLIFSTQQSADNIPTLRMLLQLSITPFWLDQRSRWNKSR